MLGRQALDRRIPDKALLTHEVVAWEARRNRAETTMHWRFSTVDFRIKLTHLYRTVQVPDEAHAPPLLPTSNPLPDPRLTTFGDHSQNGTD